MHRFNNFVYYWVDFTKALNREAEICYFKIYQNSVYLSCVLSKEIVFMLFHGG